MKKPAFLVIVLVLIYSCKPKDEVVFPDSCYYGSNILAPEFGEDTLDAYTSYSLCANLEEDASLYVYLKLDENISNPLSNTWSYDASTNDGWLISDYDFNTNSQKFTAKHTGDISLKIEFGGTGKAVIMFNGNPNEPQVAIAKQKFIYW